MDELTQNKIDRLLALTEENNKMLKSLRRSMLISRFLTVFYWVIIIGASIGALYFVRPYIETLQGLYGGMQGGLSATQNQTGKLLEILSSFQ